MMKLKHGSGDYHAIQLGNGLTYLTGQGVTQDTCITVCNEKLQTFVYEAYETTDKLLTPRHTFTIEEIELIGLICQACNNNSCQSNNTETHHSKIFFKNSCTVIVFFKF